MSELIGWERARPETPPLKSSAHITADGSVTVCGMPIDGRPERIQRGEELGDRPTCRLCFPLAVARGIEVPT